MRVRDESNARLEFCEHRYMYIDLTYLGYNSA